MAAETETVRQRRTVVVNGVPEEWLLKWTGPIAPLCSSADLASASSCPCMGFAYGEQGRLSLERRRSDTSIETMHLSSLFAQSDSPADAGNAALRHWSRNADDPFDDIGNQDAKRKFDDKVSLRPAADVMSIENGAREGGRTGFLLQIGNLPCGKRTMVFIGVSKMVPHLHAFTTAAHPERPLELQVHEWTSILKSGGPVTVTDWACGDHGSEVEMEKVISDHLGAFAVKSNTYACQKNGARGALLGSEDQ